uniref:Muniscin C-terminal domain-containing protein n=1 Tax=Catharus ustulatus TaxID=91951 RepID=A0A8C3UGT4_CATUS
MDTSLGAEFWDLGFPWTHPWVLSFGILGIPVDTSLGAEFWDLGFPWTYPWVLSFGAPPGPALAPIPGAVPPPGCPQALVALSPRPRSDPSQSDPSTKDFWLNMGALSAQLQRQAEQSPGAPYYNVVLLKYQFSRLGPGSAPLRLAVSWDCSPGCTRVTVEYGYNGAALALPAPLANVTVLLPLEEPLGNLRLQPAGRQWGLPIPSNPPSSPPGSGRLSASWEPLGGRSKPSPVAAQFSGEGSTLSGLELQLPGAAYRVSLLKKRFATGMGYWGVC